MKINGLKNTGIHTLALFALAFASANLCACEKADGISEPAMQVPAKPAGELKTIMVALESDMGQLYSALWLGDFDQVASSAMKVANHPKVSDGEKARVVKRLGSDFGAFVTLDKAVHNDAVNLSKAATAKDLPKVLNELALLQGNCVACHTQFRSKLVAK